MRTSSLGLVIGISRFYAVIWRVVVARSIGRLSCSKAAMRLPVAMPPSRRHEIVPSSRFIAQPCWSLSTVAAGTPAMLLESK